MSDDPHDEMRPPDREREDYHDWDGPEDGTLIVTLLLIVIATIVILLAWAALA